jgi:hypothetical protein
MNIDSSIIVAIITGAFATVGVMITNTASNKKNSIDQAIRDTRIEDQIKELSARVDAHNGLADKINNIEKAIVKINTKLGDD